MQDVRAPRTSKVLMTRFEPIIYKTPGKHGLRLLRTTGYARRLFLSDPVHPVYPCSSVPQEHRQHVTKPWEIRGSLKSSQKNKKSHDCKSRNQTHRCLISDLCSSVSICGFPFFCFALVAASPRWVLSCPEHQAQVINDLNATGNDAVNAANAIR